MRRRGRRLLLPSARPGPGMEVEKMDENEWKYHGEGNQSLVVSHCQVRGSPCPAPREGGGPAGAAARPRRPPSLLSFPEFSIPGRSGPSREEDERAFPRASVTASEDGRESSPWPGSCLLEMGAASKSAKNSPFPSSFSGVGDVTGESELVKACFPFVTDSGSVRSLSARCSAGPGSQLQFRLSALPQSWCGVTPAVTSSPFSHLPVGPVFCFVDSFFSFFFFLSAFLWGEGHETMEMCFIKKFQ